MNNTWQRMMCIILVGLVMTNAAARAEEKAAAEQLAFFESKIRPVLVAKCYACHSAEAKEVQGGLLLDTRAGIRRGGDSGAAVVPGDGRKSLLLTAIRYSSRDLEMPPRDSGGKLPEQVIRDFETWISAGAADPRDGAAKTVAKYDTSNAKSWWSFQPLREAPIPRPKNAAWAVRDLDRFVLAKLEEKSLRPVEDASPLTLLRRLHFDLTGLPPTANEIVAFMHDWEKGMPQAVIEATVDRLLASPEYGERWGRRWLDVARYAESSGKDVNVVFPHAWRYRDYVIQAFQNDVPFDRFLLEQLAGDLLPARSDAERARQLTATGFLAIGAKSLNETNARQFAVDLADEQIDATSQAFLGLTVACARCHDHRFDPISQRDYTALAGIFLSSETRFGTPGGVQGRNQSTLVELPAAAKLPIVAVGISAAERSRKQEQLDRLRQQQRTALAARANGKNATDGLTNFDVVRIITQAKQLETELSVLYDDGSPKPLTMGVAEKPVTVPRMRGPGGPRGPGGGQGGRQASSGFEQLRDSPLFARGNLENAGETVKRGVPTIVSPTSAAIPATASGRRELAESLISADNRLTSRVIVNRVWHWLFGRGLVASVDNFGTTGGTPSHAELLDTLTVRFMRDGWSIKRLVREIATSHAYRLAASHDETNFTADPENQWLWRHSPRRLEAEELRDSMLAIAERLQRRPPTASLIGRAVDGPIGGERRMALTEAAIAQADHDFRSIYLPIARNVQPDLLATFDLPDAAAVQGARNATNVPSQALFLLNSEFVERLSRSTAEKMLQASPGSKANDKFDERLNRVWAKALGRPPSTNEATAARRLLERHATDPVAAWSSVVRGLFASAEFRFVD